MDTKVVSGILYGYLPFQGEMEIMTVELSVVQHFQIGGEVRAAMLERPNCYVRLIGRRVLADVERRKVVGLRLAPRP